MAGPAPQESFSYKVVELPDVTDAGIEAELNRWSREGYRFESIHFVVQQGNRRPVMAFLFFIRGGTAGGA